VGVSVTKSGNDALYNNLLHALFYILSINAEISTFSEAEVLISIRFLESTNRKRPEEEPIARGKKRESRSVD
jgi:hypothetical protein